MKTLSLLFSLLLCAGMLAAQTSKSKPSDQAGSPDDVSGMYAFLQEGEFVQISVDDQNKLTGFVSRYGDLESDRGAFLDQFFKTASFDGRKMTWTTEQVHGVTYEFKGTVSRGDGKTPSDQGYYVLKGTLTEYTADANKKTSAKSREVNFKSFPKDEIPSRPKRD